MKRRVAGFTLIEMVVVVALVGILASALVPLAELSVQRSREQELRQGLRQIRAAIDAYRLAVDEGRVAKKSDETGYPPDLEALERGAEDQRYPGKAPIRFLRRLPRDPFFPDPAVPAAETWAKRSYASPPDSPAEGRDVFDIYSRSEASGLNGIPYREW